jgi:hypothetical protein
MLIKIILCILPLSILVTENSLKDSNFQDLIGKDVGGILFSKILILRRIKRLLELLLVV